MPRTKGSKNRPKTNNTKGYATQIAEKQETITSLNTEIASIQKAIEEQKNILKEKNVYYDENVPLFRRNGYRKSGTMILRVRSRDTALN